MSVIGVICSHCRTINTMSARGCIKCGKWLSPNTGKIFRRRFLIGAGAFLFGCAGLNDIHALLSGPLFPDTHLFFEMDWLDWFSFAWMSDSKHLICLKCTGELAILDITSKQMRFLKPRAWNEDMSNSMILHTWSNDRKYLAYSEKFQGVGILDLESGEHIQIQPELHANAFAWSPDGSQFAYLGVEEDIRPVLSVWNTQGWRLAWKKDVHREKNIFIYDIDKEVLCAWSPDGKYVSFSFTPSIRQVWQAVDNSSSIVQVWRASDGRLLWTQKILWTSGIDALHWSADSSALAVSSLLPSDTVFCRASVWNVKSGQKLFESRLVRDIDLSYWYPSPAPFAWSPNGARLAFFVQVNEQYVMRVWDRHTGHYLFSSPPLSSRNGGISWSPNGQFIATGCYAESTSFSQNVEDYGAKSTIQFWNAQNGQELISYEAPRQPYGLTWSPDSRFLVALNTQTVGCGWHGCEYGVGSQNGVGSQRLQSAFQIFPAPDSAF